MDFIKRLRFFLLGVCIGILIIINFFGKRIFFYNYFPNQRILSSLKKKNIVINKKCYFFLPKELKLYTNPSFIKEQVFTQGNIYFSKSLPRKKPFPLYQIYYDKKNNDKIYIFIIENQPKKVIIQNIRILQRYK